MLLGRTWILALRLLHLEFTISQLYVHDLFQVLPAPFVLISTTWQYLL